MPEGYHFAPFEQQLISLYLKRKVLGQKLPCNKVEERQLYGPYADPWQLFDPENHPWILSEVTPGKYDKITYVFVNLTKKSTAEGKKEGKRKGKRDNYIKKAGCGTWDGQTKRTEIRDWNGDLIGERRMLAFEINEVPDEDLSKLGHWRMHEYHLCGINKDIRNPGNTVLCKITLDSSKNPAVKLKLHSKVNNEPEKKSTIVHIASSSGSVGSNQGDFDISDGAITTQTRRDDSVGSDSGIVKGKEGIETPDGVECVKSSIVEEEDIAVIVSSPPKQVKTGNLNPSISDFHWPAKKDKDSKKIKTEGGGDLDKVQFSKEEQPVEDTTTNQGKRKLGPETSYTMAKKLRPWFEC
ncbi:hypothetical protein POM88_026531 [Heracleum sosnowskyi]|uniref:NAC domain-containing protein n=1 Tax=Heracleum sosnowskyi TaxID=360622 RepID=A0AAD8MP04_9APIA|nr:hypothetical protein POM88_026531 [Heracleum sosnowskyi]